MASTRNGNGFLVGLIGSGIGTSLTPAHARTRGRRAGHPLPVPRARPRRPRCPGTRRRRAGGGRPARRLRRPQRHPPGQAARPRPPRRAVPRRGRGRRRQHDRRSAMAWPSATTPTCTGFARALPTGLPGRGAGHGGAPRRGWRGRRARARAAVPRACALRVVDVDPAARAGAGGPPRRPGHRESARRSRPARRWRTDSSTPPRPAWRATRAPVARRAAVAPDLWVADIVYRPLETELLPPHATAAAWCSTVAGWPCSRPSTRSGSSPAANRTRTGCCGTSTRSKGGNRCSPQRKRRA